MTNRVKVGDMAVVISDDPRTPENIGIICKVLEYVGFHSDEYGICTDGFVVETVCRLFKFGDEDFEKFATYDAYHLRPISGLPDTDTIDTDQPIDAEVLT